MRYDNVQKAKVKSQLENKQRQLVNKSHNSRLNTLIDSNDLVRKGIPANGDCFFNAVCVQLNSHLTGTELRQKTV